MTDPLIHVRARIRKRAKALLLSRPTTGLDVFVGRTWPTDDAVMPCLLVYTLDEPVTEIAMGPTRQQRGLSLKVMGRARVSASAAAAGDADEVLLDTLDAIALEVESALLAPDAFAGLIQSIALNTSITTTQATTDRRDGQIEMDFQVEYHTEAGAPGIAL